MRVSQSRLASACALALAAALQASAAHAAVVTQTVGVPGQTLFNAASFASTPLTISTTLNAFDGSLGTLASVSLAYTYNFSVLIDLNEPNPYASGEGAVRGNHYRLNNGTQVSTADASGSTDFSISNVVALDPTTPDLLGLGSFAFTFGGTAMVNGGGQNGPVFTTFRLLDTSSVTVTYTYDATPAVIDVPEPSALALVLVSGAALVLQRRRTRQRQRLVRRALPLPAWA